ncbi:hypothetical protein DOY81_007396 [Sarcophaga bullata]|nr:hypothetical protein DOY81_007396 [Sarcophaga bullata]
MDAYALPPYFPLAYSDLQYFASRRAAAVAAATVLPPPPAQAASINGVRGNGLDNMPTAHTSEIDSNTTPAQQSNGQSSMISSHNTHIGHAVHHHGGHTSLHGPPPPPPPHTGPTQPHDFHPAYRIPGYIEHLYSLQRVSPTSSFHDPYSNCATAFHLTGLGLNSGDYLGARGVGSLGDLHPTAANSLASTDFHFSIDNSRLSTSRTGSIRASVSRKRALSSSPYSDSFDISSMIRFSPNSLATIMNGSRASSAASGSYGHLSAGAMSPMHSAMTPHLQQLQAHLLRASAGLLHPLPTHQAAAANMLSMGHVHTLQSAVAAAAAYNVAAAANSAPGNISGNNSSFHGPLNDHTSHTHATNVNNNQNNVVNSTTKQMHYEEMCTERSKGEQPSSTSHNDTTQQEADSASTQSVTARRHHRNKVSTSNNSATTPSTTSPATQNQHSSSNNNHVQCGPPTTTTPHSDYECTVVDTTDIKDEPGDFIETNCHWQDCGIEFMTQDELVKHINNDHIQNNKKAFICRWEDCTRGEKPFKAQYMLVVHMRRHTGEKPHKCTKPYVCKAPGCIKRYTDPSSLRKHVKTVHGAEFYANKKHKGSINDNDNPNGGGINGSNLGKVDSPDECRSHKAASLSSPSIKSESDVNSPPQPSVHSPTMSQKGGSQQTIHNQMQFKTANGIRFGISAGGDINDGSGSYNNPDDYNILGNDEEAWLYDDDVDAADLPIVLRAMVSLSNSPNNSMVTSVGGASSMSASSMRQRFRSRLQAKGINLNSPVLSNIPEINRTLGIGELNKRITDLKMEPGATGATVKFNNDSTKNVSPNSTNLQTELQTRLYTTNNNGGTIVGNYGINTNNHTRRDSQNSNASTYYCSMQSRRSSQCSQLSSISTMRPCSYNAGSLYDPISPGCSRRSSQLSNITAGSSVGLANINGPNRNVSNIICDGHSSLNGNIISANNNSLPPPPSSHLISTHLPRLQTSSSSACLKHPHESGRFSIPNAITASQIGSHMMASSEVNNSTINVPNRRQSEPVPQFCDRLISSPNVLTSAFQNVAVSTGIQKVNKSPTSTGTPVTAYEVNSKGTTETSLDHHPNEKVNLDEVEEDELIENKLVLPDEMLQYLNQVADKTANNTSSHNNNSNTSEKESIHAMCHLPIPSPNLYPNSPESPSTITQVMSPQSGHTMSALGSPYSQRNYDQRSQTDIQCRQYPIYYDYYQKTADNTNFTAKKTSYFCTQQPTHSKPIQELTTTFSQNITAAADSSMTSLPDINIKEAKSNYNTNNATETQTPPQLMTQQSDALQNEIQCQDITQSQMSPAVINSQTCNNNMDISYTQNTRTYTHYIPTSATCYNINSNCNTMNANNTTSSSTTMCTDAYQRTLEYVQNCQSWLQAKNNPNQSSTNGEFAMLPPTTNRLPTGQLQTDVTSSTHPSSNMVINDMTTSLSSFLEENRYLQMIQ